MKTMRLDGIGSFAFDDAIGRTITVWYACPEQMNAQTPVLFVMHGVQRNGEQYRDAWIEGARAKRALLVVPEFSKEQFPTTEQYNYGDVFDATGAQHEPSQWTFTAIERIFDRVKQSAQLAATTYHIYGHSAGAQFVHRLAFFLPAARLARIVSANAGWYTMPRDDIPFPYGLQRTPITREQLSRVFAKPLIVLLGEADTNSNDPNLRNTEEARAQGVNRLERGKNFYAIAQRAAAAMATPFNWQIAFVPGIGHHNPGMAKSAIGLLFPY